jgi:hypothetical protein
MKNRWAALPIHFDKNTYRNSTARLLLFPNPGLCSGI